MTVFNLIQEMKMYTMHMVLAANFNCSEIPAVESEQEKLQVVLLQIHRDAYILQWT